MEHGAGMSGGTVRATAAISCLLRLASLFITPSLRGCATGRVEGARLRLARAYLAAGGDARGARGATRPTFDPGDADHFAAAASPVLRGLPGARH